MRALQPNTGEKCWRRNGWQTVERRLIKVLDTQTLGGPESFAGLLPPDLPKTFTTADIAAGLEVPMCREKALAPRHLLMSGYG